MGNFRKRRLTSKNLAWPTDQFGKPLTFLAQYCFVDSYDHMGALPGDVFLIFIKDIRVHKTIDLEFEWHNLGIDDLVMAAPPPAMEFPTCYAVRHRSRDFSDESIAGNALKMVVERTALMHEDAWSEELVLRAISCYRGMKIGGVPFWEHPLEIQEDVQGAGKFLCAFNGINTTCYSPCQLTNVSDGLALDESISDTNRLALTGGLITNFYFGDDGLVSWFSQFT